MVTYMIVCGRADDNMTDSERELASYACFRIGFLHYDAGRYSKAMQFYLKGLRLCESTKEKKYAAGLYKDIGIIYNTYSDFEKGMHYLRKGEQMLPSYPDPYMEYKLRTSILFNCLSLNDSKGAEKAYSKLRQLKYGKTDTTRLMDIYTRALIDMQHGQLATAAEGFMSDGEWTLSVLSLPEGVEYPGVRDISGNGHVIIGGGRLNEDMVAVCWKDGVAGVITGPEKEHPEDFNNIQPLAISDNGRFVALSVNFQAYIYDMETGEYRAVKPWSDYSQISQTVAIDDEGNLYGNYSGYPDSRPFVYLFNDKRIADMGYYLSLATPGFEESTRFAKGAQMCFVSVTPDGHRFIGNTSSWGGQGWIWTSSLRKQ